MNIRKHIPNTITSMNLLCGSLGVIFSFRGQLDIAFYLMIAAATADFFDGLSARLLGAYSPMGKELDSLADMVSFGLLPSLMLYVFMSRYDASAAISSAITDGAAANAAPHFGWLIYTPLLIAIFSGLRLAKFNVDERQSSNFIGLATPACAMICSSLMCFVMSEPTGNAAISIHNAVASLVQTRFFLPIISLIFALLLVSEIPMFAMKIKKSEHKGGKIEIKGFNLLRVIFAVCFLAALIVTLVLKLHWSFIILATFTSYLLINLVYYPLGGKHELD